MDRHPGSPGAGVGVRSSFAFGGRGSGPHVQEAAFGAHTGAGSRRLQVVDSWTRIGVKYVPQGPYSWTRIGVEYVPQGPDYTELHIRT